MRKTKQTAQTAGREITIPKTPFGFIRYISRPYPWWAFGAIATATVGQVSGSAAPYIVGQLTDGITSATTQAEVLAVMSYWGIIFLALTFIMYVGWRTSGLLGMVWITRANAYAYDQLYGYVTKHSHTYFINRFAGALSNKVSNGADGAERLINRLLWGAYPQVVATFVNAALLSLLHPLLGIGFFTFVVVIAALNYRLVRWRRPYVVTFARASSKLRGEGVDLLTNITASRQYVRLAHEAGRLGDTVLDRRHKDVRQWRIGEFILIINNVAAFLLSAVVIAILYFMLQTGAASVGDAVLTIVVLFRVGHTFVTLGEMMNGLIRIYGDVEEGLKEVLQPYEIIDIPAAAALTVPNGQVDWQNVTFTYDDNHVFDDFSLSIKDGERVGLVGPSGAGKTTFVSLLLRQHELNAGAILIDNQNISTVTQDSLRENIAVVPQEPLLFHRTITENIAYGKEYATEEEIEAVAKKAQAHEFISMLPEGYNTLVGERGVKLSGGQKQRIAIARAMLKDAPLLVLDEATSALDSESEVAIQAALHKLMEGKTVVAIAHRLSTLREMDRIIVLEAGKIVEDGTHDQLAQAGGTYQRLWEHQAGGFLQE